MIERGLFQFVEVVNRNAVNDVQSDGFGGESRHSLVLGVSCADLDDHFLLALAFERVVKHNFVVSERIHRGVLATLYDFKNVCGIEFCKLRGSCGFGFALHDNVRIVCRLCIARFHVDISFACKNGFARNAYGKRRVRRAKLNLRKFALYVYRYARGFLSDGCRDCHDAARNALDFAQIVDRGNAFVRGRPNGIFDLVGF